MEASIRGLEPPPAPAPVAGRAAARRGRARPQDADRHVGLRLRERRRALGMSQQELADRLGVTYQQLHKYERGANRLPAGRLYTVARELGVGIGYFYEGLGDGDGRAAEPAPGRRRLLELTRLFAAIPDERRRATLCALARALSGAGDGAA